jgi:hypothetical protein
LIRDAKVIRFWWGERLESAGDEIPHTNALLKEVGRTPIGEVIDSEK